jgi:acyl-coenzyme A synthetase/AMP-(fatty) acid ligase
VVGVCDENGLLKPHAWVIPRTEPAAAEPDLARRLADFVAQELAPYKAPRKVHLVADLPRTHLGKIDRGALKRPGGAGGTDG